MSDERGNAFHESESGDVEDVTDVFDLYNACNGEVVDNVLNVQKLDELSEEEREVLDVPRLKQLAAHIVSGCAHCQSIVVTLNRARVELGMIFVESHVKTASPSNRSSSRLIRQ